MPNYIFEDAPGTGGYAPVTPQQIQSALAGSGLDQQTQTNIYNQMAPPAPAPQQGGGSNSGGGGRPSINYMDLIARDPLFGQQKIDLAAESTSDAANRALSIQRALIQYGLVPDFSTSAGRLGLGADSLGFLNSDITDQTKSLAQKNTDEGLSITARLAKQHKDQIRAIKNALAARGMISSGETGHQLGEEEQGYKQNMTDAEQQLLQYLTGAISAFTSNERERKRTLSNYMMDAAQRQANLLGDYGGDFGGSAGGSGGSGGAGALQWSGGAQSALAQAGYSDEQIANAVYGTMGQRGWGMYHGPGGAEPPQVMQNGQQFDANGNLDPNGGYIQVKVGTPGGNSTELIPIGQPGGYTAAGGSSGGGSQQPQQPTYQAPGGGYVSDPFGIFG